MEKLGLRELVEIFNVGTKFKNTNKIFNTSDSDPTPALQTVH